VYLTEHVGLHTQLIGMCSQFGLLGGVLRPTEMFLMQGIE
jgi:hypothetical protein